MQTSTPSLAAAQESSGSLVAILGYMAPRPLILDEFGYLPIDRSGSNLIFQLISRHQEKGPMISTSNQSFGAWGEVFGGNRVPHPVITLNIRGNCYRLKDKLKTDLIRSEEPVIT